MQIVEKKEDWEFIGLIGVPEMSRPGLFGAKPRGAPGGAGGGPCFLKTTPCKVAGERQSGQGVKIALTFTAAGASNACILSTAGVNQAILRGLPLSTDPQG